MNAQTLPRESNGFRLRGVEVSRIEGFSDALCVQAD